MPAEGLLITSRGMKKILSLAAILVLSLSGARANITFHIDTTAEEFWFSGSDVGEAHFIGSFHVVAWSNQLPFASSHTDFDIKSAFSISQGTLVTADYSQYPEGHGTFLFEIDHGTLNYNVGITADDAVHFSYAEFAQWRKDILTGYATAQTIFYPQSYNPGMSNINTVPEPSTWALMGLGGALLAWRLVRRQARGS